jgi:hypothetical protein
MTARSRHTHAPVTSLERARHRGHRPLARAARCCVAALLACLPGCVTGYELASAYDQSIQTVAVPIWENTTFAHGIEFQLTEAIIKELHRSTPWKVINTPGQAQAALTGAVVSVNMRKLSTDPDSGLVQDLATEVVVSFEFKDTTTGRVLVARRNFRAADSFVPSPGASERIEQAHAGAVDRLARSIVAELRQAW